MAQPRFIFALQPLLEHRLQVEKNHMRAVAEIQNKANALMSQIQRAHQDIQSENQKLTAQHLVGRLDMSYIANEKRFVGSLHMVIAMTMQELNAVDKQLAGAKALLLAAARERKVIEKLREKQHKRWLENLNRKEADAMDEIGTQLALRQMAVAAQEQNS